MQRMVSIVYNLSESISTIGNIIDELSIDESKINEFRKQYHKILTRSRDANFYLSTIGDFSSGKSTLINTMVRRKLLKVAHAATTAVPTYIYRGKNNRVVVNVKCNNEKNYDITNEDDVIRFEKEFDITLPEKIDEKISILTADKKLSLQMKEVNVELPCDEFAVDLCIIDTPGINPGADFAEKHEDITKHILNEKADAIIILFPADQAYKQSFEKFLKDNAEYFMKDAIFVVTMIDRVDEEERDDVIRFVKANLRNNFKLQDPQVLSCSAILYGKDPYWTKEFEEFEKYLYNKLVQNRKRIITERLSKLSNELLKSIQSEVLSQKTSYETRLSVLQKHSVPNLMAILEASKVSAFNVMSRIYSDHNMIVNTEASYLENKIIQKINEGLKACTTRSSVTKYVNDTLASDIEFACNDVYDVSVQQNQHLNSILSLATSEMNQNLKVYYGEIGSVLPENTSISTVEQQIDISNKITELSGAIGSYEGKIDVATAIGGAGIAAIILTGLGPIGWIIGGFAALVGGDRLFVESARNKVRESVNGKIPEISQSVKQEILKRMHTNYCNAMNALESKKNQLVAEYKPTYENLQNQFNFEKQTLTQQINKSDIIQCKIKTVLLEIDKIQGGNQ